MISFLRLFSRQHSRRAERWLRLSNGGILPDQKAWDAPRSPGHRTPICLRRAQAGRGGILLNMTSLRQLRLDPAPTVAHRKQPDRRNYLLDQQAESAAQALPDPSSYKKFQTSDRQDPAFRPIDSALRPSRPAKCSRLLQNGAQWKPPRWKPWRADRSEKEIEQAASPETGQNLSSRDKQLSERVLFCGWKPAQAFVGQATAGSAFRRNPFRRSRSAAYIPSAARAVVCSANSAVMELRAAGLRPPLQCGSPVRGARQFRPGDRQFRPGDRQFRL